MKLSSYDLSQQRPTWAEVDLDLLHSNYFRTREMVSPAGILAVVKSDAYGHGSEVVSKELQDAGVKFFGTATAMEAVELRRAGVVESIVLLSGIVPAQIPLVFDFNLTPSVHTVEFFRALQEAAGARRQEVTVHLEVDTGMGRLGLSFEDAAQILRHDHPYVSIQGMFTHFASADLPDDTYTRQQLAKFREFAAVEAPQIPLLHAANSAAILNYPESYLNLVRPGILLYGGSPVMEGIAGLTPILSLKSKIIALRKLQTGQSIGYGRIFTAQRESCIATVPFGYADGLRRALSNRLEVEIHGVMCPVAGAISMDLCMVDVTAILDRVHLEDVVTFLGPRNSAWHWARLLNTVPYEVTCLIGARVPRVYLRGGKVVEVYYP